ncbi:hypothetical protein Y032_0002g1104 [Ancylostoma ceylanicum]|uniref:Phosphoserine phosphatase n=1 Tax=Ancylostoma ceylanicum TaxID=53326 RepID=A0A016W1A6_9BILA|nr:hypothetical protein Y032_0002g1104 [Ancylostoma ceylanicum]
MYTLKTNLQKKVLFSSLYDFTSAVKHLVNRLYSKTTCAALSIPNRFYYPQVISLQLTPGIRQLIIALHKRGTDVYLVSGGFRRLIYPVADILGIDRKRIYANEILFDKNKNYAGFDENEPTSDSGSKDVGKPAVMGLLKKQGYKHVVMVGDGATDLEASPPADAFIGFGGNQIREAVRARADWYVTDFDVLRKALE